MARPDGPLTVCVINLKGGVGKSTIAALLLRNALARRRDVLGIDLDPQANLSQALMHQSYRAFVSERRPSIVEIFNGYRPPSRRAATPSRLDTDELAVTIERVGENTLQIIPSRFDFSDNLIDSLRPDARVLARLLAANFRHKDLIIIDCAPTSILTRAAYHASGLVLIPVKPEYFATIGFPLLHESLNGFRSKNRGHQIDVAGVVVNNAFYDGGNNGGPEKTRAVTEIRKEAASNGWRVFQTEIPFSRGFPKIMRGDFSHSGNASAFPQFADEFFRSIGL